ncbi:MAG: hypothetical protein DYH20_11220 [Gammaproteobacteria bacterium PRO9]|nr:hypothetical protein [Gammaproteobacteria bacterium PRO9]
MRILIVIAAGVLTSTVAVAADFGALDIGSQCKPVTELETARGSLPIPWPAPEVGEFYAFRGRAFDRDASLLYLCRNGVLVAGNYYLPVEPLARAKKSYYQVYEQLVSMYGEPPLNDFKRFLESLPDDPRSMSADSIGPMTWWWIGNLAILQTLMPVTNQQHIGWQVFIVITSRHDRPKSY